MQQSLSTQSCEPGSPQRPVALLVPWRRLSVRTRSTGWGSLFIILLFSPQVILKDLEVLAEIASSPAGQADDPGALDGPDLRVSHSELQAPTPGRAGLLNTPGESSLPRWLRPRGPWAWRCSVLPWTSWHLGHPPEPGGSPGTGPVMCRSAGSLTFLPPTPAAPTLSGDPHSPFPHLPATLGPLSYWLNVKPSKSADGLFPWDAVTWSGIRDPRA